MSVRGQMDITSCRINAILTSATFPALTIMSCGAGGSKAVPKAILSTAADHADGRPLKEKFLSVTVRQNTRGLFGRVTKGVLVAYSVIAP
jgi:hypothetical protein